MSVWASGNAAARLKLQQQQQEKQRLEAQQQQPSAMVEVKAIVKGETLDKSTHNSTSWTNHITASTSATSTPAVTSITEPAQAAAIAFLKQTAPTHVSLPAPDAATAASTADATVAAAAVVDVTAERTALGDAMNKVQLPSHLTALLSPGRFIFARHTSSVSDSAEPVEVATLAPADGHCLPSQSAATTDQQEEEEHVEETSECQQEMPLAQNRANDSTISHTPVNHNGISSSSPYAHAHPTSYNHDRRNHINHPRSFRGRYGARTSGPAVAGVTPYAQWAAPYIHNSFGAIPREYEMRKQMMEMQHTQGAVDYAASSYSHAGFAGMGLNIDATPYTMHAAAAYSPGALYHPSHFAAFPPTMMSSGSRLAEMPGNFYGRLQPRPPYVPPPM